MVIIPNEFESFLTLTEAFNSFFEKENDEYLRMFLKITNVNTLSDSTKLREIADYLHSEGVPFIIVLDEILDIKNLSINENFKQHNKTLTSNKKKLLKFLFDIRLLKYLKKISK